MYGLSVIHFPTVQALQSDADRWDDLWVRSAVTAPTARFAPIQQWVEQFSWSDRFRAVAVCQDGRFVAALPTVTRTKKCLFKCADIPGNEWSSAGQLLLDRHCDHSRVCDRLVTALVKRPCSAFWFAAIPLDAPDWRALVAAVTRAGLAVSTAARYRVGRLVTQAPFSVQQALWSQDFRRKMSRAIQHLESEGPLVLRQERPSDAHDAQQRVREGLELEHAGWKGRERSSILSSKEMTRFFERQAALLAESGHLELNYLEQRGHLVAFEYGWLAKQVYHSFKIAYNERFKQFSPGQLLTYFLLREMSGRRRAIDFLGPMDQAACRWRPESYTVGRLVFSTGGFVGRALCRASRIKQDPGWSTR